MTTDKPTVSSCCAGPVEVAAGDEGTNYYVCRTCGKACDSVADCSRILITLEITDPEIVADYKDICDEILWEDLVNGLIHFAGFVSRENAQDHP